MNTSYTVYITERDVRVERDYVNWVILPYSDKASLYDAMNLITTYILEDDK